MAANPKPAATHAATHTTPTTYANGSSHNSTRKLCTAAEIAHLSTYLGLDISREQVRKRINQWHRRNQITRKGGVLNEPTFRFGDALALLAKHDTAGRPA